MKIGSLEPKIAPAPAATERKAGPAAASPGTEASAQVDLSASATMRAQGGNEATFDQAKVERIALEIREGRYQVNAGAIADKLIANAAELLGRSSR